MTFAIVAMDCCVSIDTQPVENVEDLGRSVSRGFGILKPLLAQDPLLFALLHLVRADAGTVHRPVHLTGRGLRYARYLSA